MLRVIALNPKMLAIIRPSLDLPLGESLQTRNLPERRFGAGLGSPLGVPLKGGSISRFRILGLRISDLGLGMCMFGVFVWEHWGFGLVFGFNRELQSPDDSRLSHQYVKLSSNQIPLSKPNFQTCNSEAHAQTFLNRQQGGLRL